MIQGKVTWLILLCADVVKDAKARLQEPAACALAMSGVVPLFLQVEQCCQADQSISAAWMPWGIIATD